jgi:hypothetical protein
MAVQPTEIDIIEQQQTEKIETEVRDDDRIRKHIGVSFWGTPFTQYHILFPPCQQAPIKKGNSQMESSVQNNPAAPSPVSTASFKLCRVHFHWNIRLLSARPG